MKTTNFVMAVLCALIVTLVSSCGQSQNKEIDINKINDVSIIQPLIEKSIEEGDFTKARQLNERYRSIGGSIIQYDDYQIKISKAQVAFLIDNGQYSIAADIASENNNDYGRYYSILMGKLIQLYDKDPQGLKKALLSVKLPTLGMAGSWSGQYDSYISEWGVNDIISSHNTYIEQLMNYAKANNDMEYVKQISAALKPCYKHKMVKNGWSERAEFENVPTDYTQVNQIKQSLGIE